MNESNTNDEAMVTGYEGDGSFTIVNATGSELINVRLSHYLLENKYQSYARLAIVESMGVNASSKKFKFHSTSGESDHWCIAFQNNLGCWQSYDLKASMNGDYDPERYELIITPDELTWIAIYTKNNKQRTERTKIVSVYHGTKPNP